MLDSRSNANHKLTYGDNNIKVVKEFKYIGIIFSRKWLFANSLKVFSGQAKNALHAVFQTISNFNLPINCQMKLFDQTVHSILLTAAKFGDLKT